MNRMATLRRGSTIASMLLYAAAACAQQPPGDPLSRHFFPPGLILAHGDELNLTDSQKQAVQTAADQLQKELPGLQKRLKEATATLNSTLGTDAPDAKETMEQLDKVLDGERAIKRAHIRMVLDLRRVLSAEQRKQLQKLKKTMPKVDRAAQERLQLKIQRFQRLVQARAQSGQPPTETMRQFGQEFRKLMQQGKVDEAEALLDKWHQELSNKSDDVPSEPSERNDKGQRRHSTSRG